MPWNVVEIRGLKCQSFPSTFSYRVFCCLLWYVWFRLMGHSAALSTSYVVPSPSHISQFSNLLCSDCFYPFLHFQEKNWTSLKLYLASFGYNFTCNHHVQLKVTIRLTFRIPILLKEKGNSRVGVCVCQILSQPLFLLWCFPHLKWNFSLFLPLFMWYLVVWLEYLCSKDTTGHIWVTLVMADIV